MKKHLFYTFLAIFAATAIVTMLGITGVLHIPGGYLTALVTGFLVESAGAVVAIFRRADFFTDDEQKHADAIARLQEEHAQTHERLMQATSVTVRLQSEIDRMTEENQHLRDELAKLTSLRFKILALLGADSVDAPTILKKLDLTDDPIGRNEAMSVIGKLVEDGTIEPDVSRSAGHYRLRRSR